MAMFDIVIDKIIPNDSYLANRSNHYSFARCYVVTRIAEVTWDSRYVASQPEVIGHEHLTVDIRAQSVHA